MMKARKQVGALPVRRAEDGSLEVMLVTSRETGRWVIPKGWPSKRLKDAAAAAREAKEEAGVTGKITSKAIGCYRYRKYEPGQVRHIDVSVFLLAVSRQSKHWPEEEQRTRSWFKYRSAARKVQEPELVALIRDIETLLPPPSSKPVKKVRTRGSASGRPVMALGKAKPAQRNARQQVS